jgi:hypothetical protein
MGATPNQLYPYSPLIYRGINILLLVVLFNNSCSKEKQPSAIAVNEQKNEAAKINFAEVTSESGLGNFHHDNGSFGEMWFPEQMGSGAGFIDYNDDGWVDILLVGGGGWANHTKRNIKTLWLYKNNKDGTFSEVTEETGLGFINTYGLGIVAADYDNDGDQDIFLTSLDGNILLRNHDGIFNDVSQLSGLGNRIEWSSSAIFFDADKDGWLDLYVGNYAIWSPASDLWCSLDSKTKVYCHPEMYTGLPSRFYHNNGDGTFSDHTQIAGFLPAPGKSLGVVQLDYNDDGWPDLAVANDGERDLLYQNNGDGTFTEKGTELGMAYGENGEARAGMGIDAGIVDSSGYPSIFVGNFSNEMIGVYRYSGKGWFNDRAALSRIGRTSYLSLTFGLFLFDVDLDTDLDLFVGNGHVYPFRTKNQEGITYRQVSQLFTNDGNGVFANANEMVAGVLDNKMVVRGAAAGDYDRDGDLDILLTENNGPVHLWRNNTEKKKFLRVILEGETSNRDALGAKVVVSVNGYKMERIIRTGSSYLSQSGLTASFGLGNHTTVDSLSIIWPSGEIDTFTNIKNNREIFIKEGSNRAEDLSRN